MTASNSGSSGSGSPTVHPDRPSDESAKKLSATQVGAAKPSATKPSAKFSAAMRRELPPSASLENLRNQAKALKKRHREAEPEAVARVAGVLGEPRVPLELHDAQFVLAREYGFGSWPRLVEHCEGQKPAGRVRRENDRVWIDGVGRLRWGVSAEPTYIGALEAAFRSSDRPLDVTTLMGDSGLGFRLRWATRDQGSSWCGSGPCGEWPEEVEALNAATGYVFRWHAPERAASELAARIREHIDRGWPILGFASHKDMAVVFGYEESGKKVVVSDYWASEEARVMPTAEAQEVGMFMERVDPPAARGTAVRAGLQLALERWRQGIVDPDPITGATYYYGNAAYRKWIADLERAPSLTDEQRANLFFVNSWTYSSLHKNRSEHAARYLRENAEHLPEPARPRIEAAAQRYDRMRQLLGKWDVASPKFGCVKQKKLDTWTDQVRKEEIALLRSLHEIELHAMGDIERALGAME